MLALSALTVILSLLLGGGTRSGFLSDAILQLAALPLLLFALWRVLDARFAPPGKWALRLCLAFALTPLLQLVPLPPEIWTALPSRTPVLESFQLIGSEPPFAALSVAPHATWLAGLSLIPPLAIFLGVIQLDARERRLLSLAMLAFGMAGVLLGLLQVAQGPQSGLRFFEVTNPLEAAGFFANRNHYAAFLYALTLFAAAWAVDAAMRAGSAPPGQMMQTRAAMALAASFTVLVALVGAQAMARSRAGLALTMLALLGSFAIASSSTRRNGGRTSGVTATRLLAGVIAVAMTFAAQFALYRILERFSSDPIVDARLPFARNTIEAARAFMPAGSGMGTFTSVYGLFEKPRDALVDAYANRAHNDVLEFWLEAGAPGVALMGGFALWLGARTFAVWRRRQRRSEGEGTRIDPIDLNLRRAASLVAALLAAHSLVDYPLRTSAMAAIMAFACALLVDSPLKTEAGETAKMEPHPDPHPHRKASSGCFPLRYAPPPPAKAPIAEPCPPDRAPAPSPPGRT